MTQPIESVAKCVDVPESANEILSRIVARDQVQNEALARKLPDTSKRGSSKKTSMRFTVCALGVLSLAMGQISRTVINYCITSMVDPRMLNANKSMTTAGGGSCPVNDLANEAQVPAGILIDEPEASDGDHLMGLFTTEQAHTMQSNNSNSSFMSRARISEDESDYEGEKFMWTVKQQSLIKGGFFYSYFFFMIPGGRIAEVYGAKYVLLIGVLGSAIINLATPLMARYSFPLLVSSRIVMGVIQSAGFPAMYALISRWLTISEASIFAPMLKMSLRVGQVLASLAPGLIPEWPYIFYLVGILSAIWSLAWIFLSTSDPSDNRWVSEAELAHIMANKKKKKETKGNNSAPWVKILTSPSVIGLVIAKLAFSFCNSFITVELPSYLRYVYHASLHEMSFVTTLMFSIQVPLTFLAGWLAKYMVQEHPFSMSTTVIRKFFEGMATFGSGVCLILMTFSDCSLFYTGIMLQILSLFAVFVAGGETMLPYDLSDEYPATIMAIANCVNNLSGITVTALTGFVLGNQGGNQSRWNTVILLIAAADIFGGLMFCLLVKAKPIDFGNKEEDNSIEDKEMGTVPSKPIAAFSLEATELAIQSKKANELMLGASADSHKAVYRSDSNRE